jgi:hypothetical protein
VRHWECPKCVSILSTQPSEARTPMHPCAGMRGLVVPMVAAGTKAKLEAIEREDYIAGEDVQYDSEGRPVMSVLTTRDDGEDCTVYAPVAVLNAGGNS